MDTRRTQPDMDFVREAESLIRSLAGVLHARIDATPGGIDAVHVTAASDQAAERMAGHVRSALLAGLATPVIPGRIHVRTDAANGTTDGRGPGAPRRDARNDAAPASPARDRLRLLTTAPEPSADRSAPGAGPAGAGATAVLDAEPAVDASVALPDADRHEHEDELDAGGRVATERARLVTVDVQRPGDGRVRCRVSVAWDACVHRAEAIAVDLPGASAQAAAQAAVRALASGGLEGLELSGLREVEIAGRDYVLVALRRPDGSAVRHRSGSALMFGSPERSAAEAAVCAANELL